MANKKEIRPISYLIAVPPFQALKTPMEKIMSRQNSRLYQKAADSYRETGGLTLLR
jgi:hypothetical protein